METERLASRPNGSNPRAPPGPDAAAAKPSPPILERFRALLREREEGPDGEGFMPPVTAEEIVEMYEEVLSELTLNSKPIITELTMIAGENREFGEGIADAICSRIIEVPVEHKLPSLYLLDSIVKNIGREYVRYFAARLPEVFCEAYNQVPSNLHTAMRHLFRTWAQVFPSSVLREIENELHFSSPEGPQSTGAGNIQRSESVSPHPGHGIHVNPKYLEARRQFEQSFGMREKDQQNRTKPMDFGGDFLGRSAAESSKGWMGASSKFDDFQQQRGISSSLDGYEQTSAALYREYDIDLPDVIPRHSGPTRIESVGAGRSSTVNGKEKLFSLTKVDPLRLSSSNGRMGMMNGWQGRNLPSDDGLLLSNTERAYNLSDDYSKQRPRQLIDTYGSDKRENIVLEKSYKVQKLYTDETSTKAGSRTWQNSEEEEYMWENMSPTLSDRSRITKGMRHDISVGFSTRNGLGRPNSSQSESGLFRDNRIVLPQLTSADDPVSCIDDRFGIRTMNNIPLGAPKTSDWSRFQDNHYTHEQWKSQYIPTHTSKESLSPRTGGRAFQLPLHVNAVVGQGLPPHATTSHAEVPFDGPSNNYSDSNKFLLSAPSVASSNDRASQKPNSPSAVPIIWTPHHKSHPLPPFPIPAQQNHFRSQFNYKDGRRPLIHEGITLPFTLPGPSSDAADKMVPNSSLPARRSNQNSYFNQHGHRQPTLFTSQPHDSQHIIAESQMSHMFVQSLNNVQSQGTIPNFMLPNPQAGLPLPMHRMSDTAHARVVRLPPLPTGPPPSASQLGVGPYNPSSLISTPRGGFSGLINSLASQGLISLAQPTSSKDSIGVEFNFDILKVRHESPIEDLYANLPRQCTTCGLRFKCQEEHSSHMDWHVTKNRMSKNRKQKPSRKWFVSAKEWLSGAEALGTDVVPGFLPAETIVEKKEEKELSVPADENQNLCALCGEPFEDFYSDEADEWMYKGAVYLNAPEGSAEGLDRSHLGPIVHSKCRSESSEDQRQA